MKTVEDVCRVYPQRVTELLSQLDIGLAGLEETKAASGRGDLAGAARALLEYYRKGSSGHWLRIKSFEFAGGRDEAIDNGILKDTFTFYGVTSTVPRLESGLLDWQYRGPENDHEWALALNRHPQLSQLFGAYKRTGELEYVRHLDRHLQDFLVASLPYPAVKADQSKVSTSTWRGLEVHFRALVWAAVFYGLQEVEAFSDATRLMMLAALDDHAHYLRNFHSDNGLSNFVSMEMTGLAMIAGVWPEYKASRDWMAYAKETIADSLRVSVYPDGVQKELTSHYHHVSLGKFAEMARICEQVGDPMPEDFMRTIEAMWSYLAYTLRPDGHGLLNNDSDLDYNRDRVISAAETHNRPDWLWIASNGQRGREPEGPPSKVFPWAGQLLMRGGWDRDAQWGFFDIGPFGAGHFHNDMLHLSIAAHGRDLLVDTGRFAYSGKMADDFRLSYAFHSAGHNVILVDGYTQLSLPHVAENPVDTYSVKPDFDFAVATFNGGFAPDWQWTPMYGKKPPARLLRVAHTRAVLYLRDRFWIVFDHVVPDESRTITPLWHLHPDCGARIVEGNAVETADEGLGNIRITPLGGPEWKVTLVNGQMKPTVQGWYSEKYGQAVPSPCAVYSAVIDAPTTFAWLVVTGKGAVPPIKAELLAAPAGAIRLRLTPPGEEAIEVAVRMAGEGKVQLSGDQELEGRCAVMLPGRAPQAALGLICAK